MKKQAAEADEFDTIFDRVPPNKRKEFAEKALKALADLARQYPEPTTKSKQVKRLERQKDLT